MTQTGEASKGTCTQYQQAAEPHMLQLAFMGANTPHSGPVVAACIWLRGSRLKQCERQTVAPLVSA